MGGLGGGGGPPPFVRVFRADRPFFFLIRHRASGLVLFAGRVVNPGKPGKLQAYTGGPPAEIRSTGSPPRSRPAARVGDLKVQGPGLDKATVRRVIRRYGSELLYCYVTVGLSNDPKLQGIANMSFTILASGRVSKVKLGGPEFKSRRAMKCFRSAIRRWRFPKPEPGPVTVRLPIKCHPGGETKEN